MTTWRPVEVAEDNISDTPDADPRIRRRRSRRRAWRDGLARQTVIETAEDIRSYRSFERTILASLAPRCAIELELAHRLASLFWRLRRAGMIETGLFNIQGNFLLARRKEASHGSGQSATVETSPRLNGGRKLASSIGRYPLQASDREALSTSMRAFLGLLPDSRAMAQYLLRVSNLDPALLDRVAPMKQDYGVKRRKRFGFSTR